jgi:hypothetical protein
MRIVTLWIPDANHDLAVYLGSANHHGLNAADQLILKNLTIYLGQSVIDKILADHKNLTTLSAKSPK